MSWVAVAIAGTAALGAYSSIESGKAQKRAYDAQARQAESDARTQTIERKRALIETLAQQNVGAAAQGRTISSISHLQQEDVRRAGYDETLIAGGAAAQAGAYRTAGKSAKRQGYTSAAQSLLGGAYQGAKLQGGGKA
jgi:hypothetical protein